MSQKWCQEGSQGPPFGGPKPKSSETAGSNLASGWCPKPSWCQKWSQDRPRTSKLSKIAEKILTAELDDKSKQEALVNNLVEDVNLN